MEISMKGRREMLRDCRKGPGSDQQAEPELSAETQSVSWEWIEENLGLERPKEFQTETQTEKPVELEPEIPAAPKVQTNKKNQSKRGAREEPTDGLRPAGIQRLRDLRAENNELRRRIVELERKIENDDIELGMVRIVGTQETRSATVEVPALDVTGGSDIRTDKRGNVAATKRVVCDVLFYLAIILMLAGAAVMRTTNNGAPVTIAGYSGMIVLSGSMQDVIPKGSFILTKSVDPETLQVGDDITFMINETTSRTHRIIEIVAPTYNSLAFRTQGTNNSMPDADLVNGSNIVGIVIYHSLTLGQFAEWVRANWPLLMFLLIVVATLSWVLARIAASDEKSPGRRVKKEKHSFARNKVEMKDGGDAASSQHGANDG